MRTLNFKNIDNRVDFLSVCRTKAISAEGELFTVGDLIKHDSKKNETAIIQNFTIDEENGGIIVNTDKGWARIFFITKVKQQEL